MKKIMLVLLFLTLSAWANSNPNPADYPLKVHVISSRLYAPGGLTLETTIDGTKYTLWDNWNQLLIPGDYKAKLIKDKRVNSYQFNSEYELLYPDGKTEHFQVYGISE